MHAHLKLATPLSIESLNSAIRGTSGATKFTVYSAAMASWIKKNYYQGYAGR